MKTISDRTENEIGCSLLAPSNDKDGYLPVLTVGDYGSWDWLPTIDINQESTDALRHVPMSLSGTRGPKELEFTR